MKRPLSEQILQHAELERCDSSSNQSPAAALVTSASANGGRIWRPHRTGPPASPWLRSYSGSPDSSAAAVAESEKRRAQWTPWARWAARSRALGDPEVGLGAVIRTVRWSGESGRHQCARRRFTVASADHPAALSRAWPNPLMRVVLDCGDWRTTPQVALAWSWTQGYYLSKRLQRSCAAWSNLP